MNKISSDFVHGKNFKIGNFCVIEPDVIVGDNVKLGNFALLKSGTRFDNDIDFADYCCTTGLCHIGNNVNVRTRSTISKGVIVEPRAFIGAGVMTSHTKNIYHHRPYMFKNQLITRIGMGTVIGSSSNLIAGVKVSDNVVVGYNSNVVNDLNIIGIYFGNPATRVFNLDSEMVVEYPKDYKPYEFPKELLEKYLEYWR